MRIMNCNKVESSPDINLNSSDNAVEIYPSSDLPCSQYKNYREPKKSSTQELINESKALINHAEKLMVNYKAMYQPKN